MRNARRALGRTGAQLIAVLSVSDVWSDVDLMPAAGLRWPGGVTRCPGLSAPLREALRAASGTAVAMESSPPVRKLFGRVVVAIVALE